MNQNQSTTQDVLVYLDELLVAIQSSTDNELKIINMKLGIREIEDDVTPLQARAYKAVRSLITIEKKERAEEAKEVEETKEWIERTDTTPEPAE